MKNIHEIYLNLRPTQKPNLIDLVSEAGLDVSDWANFKGGKSKASMNPKYCYEWCFSQGEIYLLNTWYEHVSVEGELIVIRTNYRNRPSDMSGRRLARTRRFDEHLQTAFELEINPRVIILDRKYPHASSPSARKLDTAHWTVSKYDYASGNFCLVRGIRNSSESSTRFDDLSEFSEGALRQRFVLHRKREAALRQKKLQQNTRRNHGRLVCEVPSCGFDFEERYGVLGQGFAEVHHLEPLSEAPRQGVKNSLDDLAVVCSNCHAMIHRGGECRPLDDIIPQRKRV